MKYGNIDSPNIIDTTCELVHDSGELGSAVASYTISNLDGNTDIEYILIARVIGGASVGGYDLRLYPNNDTTAANYGYQQMEGFSSTASAARQTAANWRITNTCNNGETQFSQTIIYAKSGKVRTMLSKQINAVTGTTCTDLYSVGGSWNNTADNITSLVIGTQSGGGNGIGIGSRFILLRKVTLTTGTKTGEIDPVGTTYGHWQLIYDNTLTAAKTNVMLTSQMDAYTKLLIHADGADASTAFYDFSNSAHAITTVGTAQVDTAQSKFGGASMLLDGNSDYVTVADSTDFEFGTGDFTWDLWVRWNSLPAASGIQMIMVQSDNTTNIVQQLYIYNNAGTYHLYFDVYNYGTLISIDRTYGFTTGVWYHLAVTRNGNNTRLFIDGVQQGATDTTSYTVPNIPGDFYIGNKISSSYYFNGWIDEVRLSKGIARWTANFTPPTRAYNELDGDRDVVYRVVARYVSAAASGLPRLMMNNDQGGTSYNTQYFNGQSTTVQAARGDTQRYSHSWSVINSGEIDLVDYLIYAKSGFVRPCIINSAGKISGTTITDVNLNGSMWKDVTSNVTRLWIDNPTANAHGIGTHIELWRLNL